MTAMQIHVHIHHHYGDELMTLQADVQRLVDQVTENTNADAVRCHGAAN